MTRNSGRPSQASIPLKSMRMGSSFWVGVYPEVCEESCACQEAALSPLLSNSDTGLKLGEEPEKLFKHHVRVHRADPWLRNGTCTTSVCQDPYCLTRCASSPGKRLHIGVPLGIVHPFAAHALFDHHQRETVRINADRLGCPRPLDDMAMMRLGCLDGLDELQRCSSFGVTGYPPKAGHRYTTTVASLSSRGCQ